MKIQVDLKKKDRKRYIMQTANIRKLEGLDYYLTKQILKQKVLKINPDLS